jgi:hypothetical protein
MKNQKTRLFSIKNKSLLIVSKILLIALILGIFPKAFCQEKRVRIEISFFDTDSLKQIKAVVSEQDSLRQGVPIEGLDLYFYVQRSFSLLPIGSVFNTTDESGKVEIDFPKDLPGDVKGNIILFVKIEDSPPYRDTILQRTIAWGIPLIIDEKQNKRTLWAAASNAPLPLILLVNSILLIVWGLILYILLQLYMIHKEA